MEAIHKLIDRICDLTIADVKRRENLHTTIGQCEAMGCVKMQEVRQMAMEGLPVISAYSRLMQIPISEGHQRIGSGAMSYSDLCCVLGIVAQDWMARSQSNVKI